MKYFLGTQSCKAQRVKGVVYIEVCIYKHISVPTTYMHDACGLTIIYNQPVRLLPSGWYGLFYLLHRQLMSIGHGIWVTTLDV